MNLKHCASCKTDKPATTEFFYRIRTGDPELQDGCKVCRAGWQRAKRLRQKIGKPYTKKRIYKHQHPLGKKICARCLEAKPRTLEHFYACKEGTFGLQWVCRECSTDHNAERRAADWSIRLSYAAKGRHTTRGYPGKSDISPEYLRGLLAKQDGRCAWFGVPLSTLVRRGTQNPYQLTIDRLDCDKGYIKDNVVLACFAANAARSNLDPDDFRAFVADLRQHLPS